MKLWREDIACGLQERRESSEIEVRVLLDWSSRRVCHFGVQIPGLLIQCGEPGPNWKPSLWDHGMDQKQALVVVWHHEQAQDWSWASGWPLLRKGRACKAARRMRFWSPTCPVPSQSVCTPQMKWTSQVTARVLGRCGRD